MEPNRQLFANDKASKGERMGRTAHVLFHEAHSARRFEVEPAAVEADALADDGDTQIVGLAPFELDQPWSARLGCGASHGGDQRIARGEILSVCDADLGPGIGSKLASGLFQLCRTEIARRRVDEVPN